MRGLWGACLIDFDFLIIQQVKSIDIVFKYPSPAIMQTFN